MSSRKEEDFVAFDQVLANVVAETTTSWNTETQIITQSFTGKPSFNEKHKYGEAASFTNPVHAKFLEKTHAN